MVLQNDIIIIKVNNFSDIKTKKIPNFVKKPINGGIPPIENKTINKFKANILFVLFNNIKSLIFLENLFS